MVSPSALALFGTLGTTELIVILLIVLLLFGASKLPQLGGALGKTIRGFKQEMREGAKEDEAKAPSMACPKCGAPPSEGSKFCAKCGAPLP